MTDKERIEVYVNELPTDCNSCQLGYFYDCQYCMLRHDLADKNEWCEKEKHCPLKTIQSVQNQKAVEALQKVKEHYEEQLNLAVYQNEAYNKKWYGTPDYGFGFWSNDILNKEIKLVDQLIKEYGGKE